MSRTTTTVIAVLLLTVVGSALASSAFTAASIDRSADIDVVADQDGLLALTDGTSGPLVYYANEQLAIDFEQGTATGANVDAQFVLGDTADPTAEYAFSVTNNDAEAHDVVVEYATTVADDNADHNVRFVVFDGEGTQVADVSEETGALTVSTTAAETLYVVVVVDTGHGVSTVLTSGDDLSGTLSFTIDDNAN
jgi:hypothetical protein